MDRTGKTLSSMPDELLKCPECGIQTAAVEMLDGICCLCFNKLSYGPDSTADHTGYQQRLANRPFRAWAPKPAPPRKPPVRAPEPTKKPPAPKPAPPKPSGDIRKRVQADVDAHLRRQEQQEAERKRKAAEERRRQTEERAAQRKREADQKRVRAAAQKALRLQEVLRELDALLDHDVLTPAQERRARELGRELDRLDPPEKKNPSSRIE